jgi:hypothetical protein
VLRDTREHRWPDLVSLVEGEHVVVPAFAREHPMRSSLPLDGPADTLQCCEQPPRRLWPASGSRYEQILRFVGYRLAVLDTVSDHPERERDRVCPRLRSRCAIGEDARQCRYLTDPTAIILAPDLDLEHGLRPHRSMLQACVVSTLGATAHPMGTGQLGGLSRRK